VKVSQLLPVVLLALCVNVVALQTPEKPNIVLIMTDDASWECFGAYGPIKSKWNGRIIKGGKGNTKDMGTHVPLIACWKGKGQVGAVCRDLVDFTDVYPTLAELAGVEIGKDGPQDGQSFLPQILGLETSPRTHALCHYQPYWRFGGKYAGAFVRTDRFKLYADGRFYDIANDLDEAKNLAESFSGEQAITTHQQLKELIDQIPPVPPGDRDSIERPVHPDWPVVK